MLYLRKLFTQDLRDGKQIAFPKEPSLSFFHYDYIIGEADRQIQFIFNAEFSEYIQYNGLTINTRLYTTKSESRIDGELKAFIRDQLNAKVDDILCFTEISRDKYEFKFIQQGSHMYPLFLSFINSKNHTVVCISDKDESSSHHSLKNEPLQQIFYGAPGTGKSHSVKKVTGELLEDGTEVERDSVFRTTFHPDTDYASFVGCYKPTMKPTTNEQKTITGKKEEIVYEFVPQVFTDAYVYAYNNPDKDTYLVIEEINRGNCAQIFGDLFQLLDRKKGVSEYKIKADKDLATYLLEAKDDKGNDILTDKIGILNGKLCLPANLNILATMNTSDQSLFPMDSAFKRRWEWEYVVIDYDEPKSKGFEIILSEDKKYNWCDFIKQVNKRIFALTQSEDKEMGNFFIKNSINAEQFKSKVMFYLWYEVLRDEVENSKYFFYHIQQDEDTGKESTKKFTYKELYGDKAETILDGFLRYIAKGAVE